MYNVSEAIKICYKPFDVVSNNDGSVGFIKEVNINDSQPDLEDQIQYSVNWLYGETSKDAWFNHSELTKHGNLFYEIAKCSLHSFGDGKEYFDAIMGKKS